MPFTAIIWGVIANKMADFHHSLTHSSLMDGSLETQNIHGILALCIRNYSANLSQYENDISYLDLIFWGVGEGEIPKLLEILASRDLLPQESFTFCVSIR